MNDIFEAIVEYVGDRFRCQLRPGYVLFQRHSDNHDGLARLHHDDRGMVLYREKSGKGPPNIMAEVDPADPDFLDQIVATLESWK